MAAEWMDSFVALLSGSAEERAIIELVITAVLLINMIVFSVLNIRIKKLTRRYRGLLGESFDKSLESALLEYMDRVNRLQADLEAASNELHEMKMASMKHIQNVGIIRFDAFEDVGGEQSFSLALLDADADGVVVSGLSGREDSRVYAKPVSSGRSKHTLSNEEIRAIARALEKVDD